MSRTHNSASRTWTQQKRRHKESRTTDQHQNPEIFPRRHPILCKIYTESRRQNSDNMRQLPRKDKMGLNRRPQYRHQHNKTETTNITPVTKTALKKTL